MENGYVKLWRKSLSSGIMQNRELCLFWVWCLMKASHCECKLMVGFQEIILHPGQFVFGRKKAASEIPLSEQEIRTCVRILVRMKNLTINSTNKFSIITIINWVTYQNENIKTNQQTNQQLTSNQPATNQQLTTNKNVKNVKNVKNKSYDPSGSLSGDPDADEKIPFQKIIEHLNNATLKNFKPDNKSTMSHITARWNQGFKLDDFKSVIDKKVDKWLHNPKMVDYLRPETLFGSKFESYLNETVCGPQLVSETTIQNMKNMDAWEKMHEEQERIQAADGLIG